MPPFSPSDSQNGCELLNISPNKRDLTLNRPLGWHRRPPIGGLTSSHAYLRPRRPRPPNP